MRSDLGRGGVFLIGFLDGWMVLLLLLLSWWIKNNSENEF
jgi:hypothetical protein